VKSRKELLVLGSIRSHPKDVQQKLTFWTPLPPCPNSSILKTLLLPIKDVQIVSCVNIKYFAFHLSSIHGEGRGSSKRKIFGVCGVCPKTSPIRGIPLLRTRHSVNVCRLGYLLKLSSVQRMMILSMAQQEPDFYHQWCCSRVEWYLAVHDWLAVVVEPHDSLNKDEHISVILFYFQFKFIYSPPWLLKNIFIRDYSSVSLFQSCG